MNQKNAKSLLDYVKADTPKYGPTLTENIGSGPGGAGATNRRVSSQTAKLTSNMPGYAGKAQAVKDDVSETKMSRAISQMKLTRDIYDSAASTIKKNKRNGRDI